MQRNSEMFLMTLPLLVPAASCLALSLPPYHCDGGVREEVSHQLLALIHHLVQRGVAAAMPPRQLMSDGSVFAMFFW